MNITIIHPHLFVKGGGERLTAILAHGLIQHGYNVSLITASIKGGFTTFEGTQVIPIKEIIAQSGFLPERIISMGLSLKKAVREFNPKFVISLTEDLLNLGLIRLIQRNAKTIQYIHFPFEEERGKTEKTKTYSQYFRYPEWLNKRFLWAADYLFCNSFFTKGAIKKTWGRDADVVYPPLDPTFLEQPDNFGKVRDNIILSVGRFTPLKRQHFLIRIFEKIKKEITNAKLIFAGFIDKRHAGYFDEIQASACDDVKFYVDISDQEMRSLFRHAKVLCHTRIGEHFGLSPIEAMSQGVPVIGYDAGGLPESVVHGKTGFLSKGDDDFIQYTKKILTMDDENWLCLHKEAVKRSHFFLPETFINGFEQYFALAKKENNS